MHTFVTPSYTLHISTHSFIYVTQTHRHTSSHTLHVTASCMSKISTHPPTHYGHKPTNTQRVKCACGLVSTYIIYAIHIDTLYMLCWVFVGVCPLCVGGCVDMYIDTYLKYATHIYIHINIYVIHITHIRGVYTHAHQHTGYVPADAQSPHRPSSPLQTAAGTDPVCW